MNDIPHINLPIATPSALFVGTLGRIFIWSGIGLFALTLIQSMFFPKRQKLGTLGFVLGSLCVIGAFVTLGSLFVRNQYEFKYVFEHSQASDALAYKIAAIWAGQEGSFLLWATTSAIFGLLTIWGTGIYRRWFTAIYAIFLASICGILAYESPFVAQFFHGQAYILPTGQGLNLSLQNYWVIIHPPTIFMGFGSLTVLFAYAFSALVTRNYKDWGALARPWALVSLSLVGIGLCMGGFWAYETLGWGGFWKWDPVENVSFVPWVVVAALVHGLIVQGTRSKWFFTNLLLAGLPFLLFVYGTFLTRAGFLDGVSVHSFAQMEHTAHMVLLTFCIAVSVGFLGLWVFQCLRDHRPDERPSTAREAWYQVGSMFLTLTAIATAVGMSVPLFMVIAHKPPKVVDEHIYHLVLAWFFLPIMFMMAIAPFVAWRKMGFRELASRIINIFSVAIGVLGISMLIMNNPTFGIHAEHGATIDFPFGLHVPAMPWVMVLVGLCLFAALANLWRIVELRRAKKTSWGPFIAHIGVATAMAGLIISRGLEREQKFLLQEQDISTSITKPDLGYTMALRQVNEGNLESPDNKLQIDVRSEREAFLAKPSFYFADEGGDSPQQVARPFIHHDFSHDSYVALGGREVQASDPFTLPPGATKTIDLQDLQSLVHQKYRFTYLRMDRQGEVGTAGTKFIAHVLVETPNGTKLMVKPAIEIGSGGGPDILPVLVDADYFLTMMRMDAGSKSVTLQVNFVNPVYFVDFFYKPMVILVWIGAGIMTLGGLLSAWSRRNLKRGPKGTGPADPRKVPEPEAELAAV